MNGKGWERVSCSGTKDGTGGGGVPTRGGGGGDRVRGQVWDGTLSEQSMVRKVWAMTALKSRLQKEATASPQERVSRG